MNSKKIIKASLALSLILGGVSTMAPPALQQKAHAADFSYTKQQQDALNYINGIRAKAGLKPVTLNPYLIKAAENHANYLSINKTTGHSEESGKKGYTASHPYTRVKAVGGPPELYNGVSEGISYEKKTIQAGIDAFLDAAYHRTPLIDPNLNAVGVSLIGGNVVIDYFFNEQADNKESSAYPYNGQSNVGVSFEGRENPNPLKKFNVSKTGYIISFTPNEEYYVENISIKLTDSKGTTVPVFQLQDEMTFHFFPKSVLKYNEKYTVSVNYKDEFTGVKGSNTWSFTTKKDPNQQKPAPKPTTPAKQATPVGKVLIQKSGLNLYNSKGKVSSKLKINETIKVYKVDKDRYDVGGGSYIKKTSGVLYYIGFVYSPSKTMYILDAKGKVYKKIKPKQKVRVYSTTKTRYNVGGGNYIKVSKDVKFEK